MVEVSTYSEGHIGVNVQLHVSFYSALYFFFIMFSCNKNKYLLYTGKILVKGTVPPLKELDLLRLYMTEASRSIAINVALINYSRSSQGM